MDNLPPVNKPNSTVTSNVVNQPPKKKSISNQLLIIILISTLGVVGALGTFFVLNQMSGPDLAEVDETLAWQVNVQVGAACVGNSAKITVKFKNTEPNDAKYAMDVTATDVQTQKSVDLGTIQPGDEKEGVIDTELAKINAGSVRVRMEWSDGRSGTDTRSYNYQAVECQTSSPTPSASATTTAKPSATVKPTATPTVKPTATPTTAPTATPTAVPSGTPPIGGPSITPTPVPTATPTVAPTATPTTTTPPAPGGDGQSDGQGCAQNDCSGNKIADNKSVADATKLPDAGIPGGLYALAGGVLFLASGILLNKQRKY